MAAFESRMASEMTRLIERYGGRPFVAPALLEIPIQDNVAALRLGARLIDGQVDILILMTGIGTTALFETLRSRHPLPAIMAGLNHTAVVARGPKPVAALKAFGMTPTPQRRPGKTEEPLGRPQGFRNGRNPVWII